MIHDFFETTPTPNKPKSDFVQDVSLKIAQYCAADPDLATLILPKVAVRKAHILEQPVDDSWDNDDIEIECRLYISKQVLPKFKASDQKDAVLTKLDPRLWTLYDDPLAELTGFCASHDRPCHIVCNNAPYVLFVAAPYSARDHMIQFYNDALELAHRIMDDKLTGYGTTRFMLEHRLFTKRLLNSLLKRTFCYDKLDVTTRNVQFDLLCARGYFTPSDQLDKQQTLEFNCSEKFYQLNGV